MVDAGVLANAEPTQILQCPDLREPRHGARQPHRKRRGSGNSGAGIAEDAGLGVGHGVLDEVDDGAVRLGLGLSVEAEDAVAVLDAGVQRSAVRAETQAAHATAFTTSEFVHTATITTSDRCSSHRTMRVDP